MLSKYHAYFFLAVVSSLVCKLAMTDKLMLLVFSSMAELIYFFLLFRMSREEKDVWGSIATTTKIFWIIQVAASIELLGKWMGLFLGIPIENL